MSDLPSAALVTPNMINGAPGLRSLMNAFTEVLKPRAVTAPQAFVAQTIRLNGLMLPEPEAAVAA